MIVLLISVLSGVVITRGFVRSIRRDAGTRATPAEWFVSAEVGFLVGVCTYALLR